MRSRRRPSLRSHSGWNTCRDSELMSGTVSSGARLPQHLLLTAQKAGERDGRSPVEEQEVITVACERKRAQARRPMQRQQREQRRCALAGSEGRIEWAARHKQPVEHRRKPQRKETQVAQQLVGGELPAEERKAHGVQKRALVPQRPE